MTLNDLLPKIIALCGQYGASGINSNNTVEEYKAKMPLLADIGQREILEAKRKYIVPYPSINTLCQPLSIDEDSAQALIYYISANLLIEENPSKADFYLRKYEEQRKALAESFVAEEEAILDVYDTAIICN